MRAQRDTQAVIEALEKYVSANRQTGALSIADAVRSAQDQVPTADFTVDEIADLAEQVITARHCDIAFDRAQIAPDASRKP